MVTVETRVITQYVVSGTVAELLAGFKDLEQPIRERLFVAVQGAGLSDTVELPCESEVQARAVQNAINGTTVEKVAVRSETQWSTFYTVTIKDGIVADCTCPAKQYHPDAVCKHMRNVALSRGRGVA